MFIYVKCTILAVFFILALPTVLLKWNVYRYKPISHCDVNYNLWQLCHICDMMVPTVCLQIQISRPGTGAMLGDTGSFRSSQLVSK